MGLVTLDRREEIKGERENGITSSQSKRENWSDKHAKNVTQQPEEERGESKNVLRDRKAEGKLPTARREVKLSVTNGGSKWFINHCRQLSERQGKKHRAGTRGHSVITCVEAQCRVVSFEALGKLPFSGWHQQSFCSGLPPRLLGLCGVKGKAVMFDAVQG